MPPRNDRFFGVPRVDVGHPPLLDTTTILSYDEPFTPPPLTAQDHRDIVQVQLDAAQEVERVLVIAAGVIVVANVVVVAAIVTVVVAVV